MPNFSTFHAKRVHTLSGTLYSITLLFIEKVKFCAFETLTDRSLPDRLVPSKITPFIFLLIDDSSFFTSISTCNGSSDSAGAMFDGKYDSFGFSICMVLHEARNKERRVTEKIMFSFFTSKIFKLLFTKIWLQN